MKINMFVSLTVLAES